MTESAKNASKIMMTEQAPKAYGNGYEVNRSNYMQQYVLHFSNGLGTKGAELVWMHIDLAELLSHDKLEGKDKDLALYLIGLAKYNDIDLMAHVTGRSLDGKDVRSFSPLCYMAIRQGDADIVKAMLDTGKVDINTKDSAGNTLLDEMYQRLIFDAKADEGNKLSVEGKKRYFEIVKALEEKGAPVGNEGLKAEFEKIRAGLETGTQEQKEGVGAAQKGAEASQEGEQKREKTVDSKVKLGQELVRLLNQHSLSDDAKTRVQELLSMKHPDEIDLNASYDFGEAGKWTALTLSALNKHEGVLKTLLEKGADVNVLATKNRSALYYAAQSDSTEMVKDLLEKGANVNGVDDANSTALHIACFFGNVGVVQTLLEVQDIDLGIKHKNGDMTPLDAVYQRLVLDAKATEGEDNKLSVEGKKRYFAIVKALEEKGAPVGNEGLKAEFEKIRAGLQAVTQEQKEGAGAGQKGARNDKEGEQKAESTEKLATILKAELDIAVSADKTQVEKTEALSKVREILKTTPEAGRNLKLDKAQSDVLLGCVNAVLNETRNLTGENVSHIQKACVALASKLTKEGAVTSAGLADEFMQREDESGHTRPELAAFEGRTDELAYYKSQGYDLNAVDPQNEGTLLHIAAVNGQTETVKWLLEKGDLSDEIRAKTSKNGNTALDSALNAMAQEGLSDAQKQNLRATAMALIEAKVGCKKEHEGTCETLIKQAQEEKKQKLNADLIALVKSGDLKDFEALIAKGADVNAVDQATVNAASGSKGRTVLDTVHDILNQDKLPDGKKLTTEQRSQYVDLARKLRDPKASGGYQAVGNEVQLKDEIVAEINAPKIDRGSVGVDARKDIRRYNDESTQGRDAYKHANERLERMAQRSFKVHREVTMNAETQKTMLENIEKVLKAQGYEGSELENQSKMMLYKLAQANVLYHPNEFVSVPDENGKPQRKRANEVMRGNFRETLCVLAKKKYEELSPEQQQQIQTSLAGIEDAVSDEGYAILNVRSGQGRNYNTTKKAGYTTGRLSEKEQARLDAELFEAVEKGDVEAINKATARGANLNATREVEVEGKKVKQTPLDVAQEPKLAAGMRRAGAKTVAGLEKERLETEIKAFETLLGKEGLSAEEYTAAMKQLAEKSGKVESAAEKSAVDRMIKMAADKAVAGSAFEEGFKASFADFDLAKHHADKGKEASGQQQGAVDKGAVDKEQENAVQGKGDAVKQARNEAFASFYEQYKGENPSEKLKAVFDHFAQGDKEFAGDEKTKLLEALDHNSDGIINEGDIERTYAWIQSEKNNGK